MSVGSSPNCLRGSPLYTWTLRGCPVRVRIQLGVVEDIRSQLGRRNSRIERALPDPPGGRLSERAGSSVFACGLLTGEMPGFGFTEISGFHQLWTLDSTEVEEALASVRGGVLPHGRQQRVWPERAL